MEIRMKVRQYLVDYLRSTRCMLWRLGYIRSQYKLRRRKASQKPVFLSLRGSFASTYRTLSAHPITQFVTPPWHHYNSRVERAFLPVPPFDFLLNPVVMETMFVTRGGVCLHEELRLLQSACSRDVLTRVLEEDYAGCPIIYNSDYCTSHNSIHHLYHAVRYQHETQSDLSNVNTVIEWGAGYGNFAKLLCRYAQRQMTYVMIDTPLFSCIQWLYLSSTQGTESVVLHDKPGMPIQAGKFNLVPLAFVKDRPLRGDLFVSTWALSESSRFAQDFVAERNWFDCGKLLLAFQESTANLPDAGRIRELAKAAGCSIHPITFMPGNSYALR